MACIIWDRAKTSLGYGLRQYNGKLQYVHRIAYCEANGVTLEEIKGLKVRHTCDNPSCYNPEHLLLGTQADNMQDKVDRNRQTKGETNPGAVLTEKQVAEIRDRYIPRHNIHGGRAMCREFGLSHSTISSIITKKNWRN